MTTMSAADQASLAEILSDDTKTITAFFKVAPKDNEYGLVPLIPKPAQMRILEAMKTYRRILIIKPRQVGSTTIITAAFTRRSVFIPYTVSVIVAHESAITERLLNRADIFYKSMPKELQVPITGDSSQHKKYATGGTMFIGTAHASVFGRGDTVHNLLASEVAHWKDDHIEKVLKPAIESVPLTGTVVLETTPNGDNGYFYDEVQKCLNGEGIYHLIVIYWWEEPDYVIEERDPVCIGKPYYEDFELNAEEQILSEQHNLSKQQIRWRRFKIDTLGDLFWQEYIEDLASCFLTSGLPYYNISDTVRMSRETYPAGDTWNNCKIWEPPIEGVSYYMGVDPGQGRQTESVACVMREISYKVPGPDKTEITLYYPKMVALLGGLIEPDHMGTKTMELGHYYNDALMIPEANGHGIAFIDAVKGIYPHIYMRRDLESGTVIMRYGWYTTGSRGGRGTKAFMMDTINRHLRKCDIPDEETLRQIRSFRQDGEGTYFTNAADDRHDAWGLALMGTTTGTKTVRGYKGGSGHSQMDRKR